MLLHEEHSMIPLLVQALADDLAARSEYSQCLALSAIANIGGKQMAEAQLAPAATKLLLAKYCLIPFPFFEKFIHSFVNRTSPNMVKKKAAMCLLQLHRKYADFITPDAWAERINQLMQLKDLGVLSSLMSLLLVIAQKEPEGYDVCVPTVIDILGKVSNSCVFLFSLSFITFLTFQRFFVMFRSSFFIEVSSFYLLSLFSLLWVFFSLFLLQRFQQYLIII